MVSREGTLLLIDSPVGNALKEEFYHVDYCQHPFVQFNIDPDLILGCSR